MKSVKTPSKPLPIIAGPTACGKTSLAISLFGDAAYTAVSADSMQVYKYMDIGTAKPDAEECRLLPHELISIKNPDETYSAGAFFRDAQHAIDAIEAEGRRACVVGGTGLYIKALVQGFFDGPPADAVLREQFNADEKDEPGVLYRRLSEVDPESAAVLHPHDAVRIMRALEVFTLCGKSIVTLRKEADRVPVRDFRIAGIIRDRDILAGRIVSRVKAMFAMGFPEEVRELLRMGYDTALPAFRGLGYQHCFAYLHGRLSREDAIQAIAAETRAFASRQIKLFKQISGLVWFHADDEDGLREYFSACL